MTAASSSSTERRARSRVARIAAARLGATAALGCVLVATSAGDAAANLRVCNMTDSRVGVAIGHLANGEWTTEGWWNLPPRDCQNVKNGELDQQFYYFYAIDYDRGGTWGGPTQMCIDDTAFTIVGYHDCLARGYDRAGFREIDTRSSRNWQIQLTDPDRPGAALR